MPWIADPQIPNTMGPAAPAQHGSRKHKPVKRQASAMSGAELLQPAHFAASQQVGWVQLWPASYQLQQQQLASLGASSASTGAVVPAAVLPAAYMQTPTQSGTAGAAVNSYGYEAAAGQLPSGVLGMPLAGTSNLAGPPGPAMQPERRLPKRRASAPHLLAAPTQRQPMYKCVPHIASPECQCTQCLCARTDELCQRLIAQHNAQAAAAATTRHDAAAAAPAGVQHPQQQPQQQQVQGGQPGQSRRQSPVPAKRRSFDLPPLATNRMSPGRRSSHSPQQHSPVGHPASQQPIGMPSAFSGSDELFVWPGPTAEAAAGAAPGHYTPLAPVSSGQLRGQFQALAVTPNPFADTSGALTAANATASQQPQQLAVGAGSAGVQQLGCTEPGSCQSAIGDDAELDLELEQMLAQVAWLVPPAANVPDMPQQEQVTQQQRAAPQQQPVLPMQAPPGTVASGKARFGRQQQHQQQPQMAAGAQQLLGGSGVACEPTLGLDGGGADLRTASFDSWSAPGALWPELCDQATTDGGLLDDLLASNPEEASLVDLLLN